MTYWLASLLAGTFVCGLLFSLLAVPLVRRAAVLRGFFDRPGGHKSHARRVPYGGGIAFFWAGWLPPLLALVAASQLPSEWIESMFGPLGRDYVGGLAMRATSLVWVAVGGFLLHVLGWLDDVRPLGAWQKLIPMAAVCLLAATLGDVRVVQAWSPAASIALTVVWMLVVINAFNFLDNMDGLSAGVASICLAALTGCGLLAGQVFVPLLGSAFCGAALGFLVYNLPPARIFMGDAGSLTLGYWTAILSVLTTYYESGAGGPPYALAMPMIALAIPLYDFASVVLIRTREGRSPLQGDQRHFSHRLVSRGLTRGLAVLTICIATAATGLAATLLPGADLRETLTVLAVVGLVVSIIAILERPSERANDAAPRR